MASRRGQARRWRDFIQSPLEGTIMPTAVAEVTTEVLQAFADARKRHDVDALMSFMTEDCVFEASADQSIEPPRGGDPLTTTPTFEPFPGGSPWNVPDFHRQMRYIPGFRNTPSGDHP